MSDYQLLSNIVGYVDAMAAKEVLAENGTDFTEKKGAVRRVIHALHPKRLTLRVVGIKRETSTTVTIRLQSEDGQNLPPFQAGQYINLFVDIDGVKTARPYAIASSSAHRQYYEVTVKKSEGGYVSHYLVDQLQLGQVISSSGPVGDFHHNPLFHGEDLVFLAGGSGSVPARSMMLNILDRGLPYRFHLIYSNSYEHDVIYAEELEAIVSRSEQLRLTSMITRPSEGYEGLTGRLTAERLTELLGSDRSVLASKMYYLCGPTPFNDSCAALLTKLGVPSRRIRIEANGAPKNPNTQQGWPEGVALEDEVTVTVKGRGSFISTVGEPLLNALERNGYGVENACRSGEYSLCRVKLVSGRVYNPQEAHLRKSDRDFGWIYSCVAFPLEDIEVEI